MVTTGAFGSSVRRIEDPRFLTGQAQYVDDIEIKGIHQLALLRSSHARANILSVDISKAEKLPGVVRILLGEEFSRRVKPLRPKIDSEKFPGTFKTCETSVVANKRVNFMGEIVAAVVATDRYIAEDAVDLIEVDYEALEAVVDPEAAAAPDSPLVHPEWDDNIMITNDIVAGDPTGAFENADAVVKARFRLNRHTSAAMEGRAVLAKPNSATGELTVWTSSQSPHVVRTHLARVIDHPTHLLRVIAPDVGGGFGPKTNLYPEEIICSLLARELKRPVKWIEDRKEGLEASYHSKDILCYIELAASNDGMILGVKGRFIVDVGAAMAFPWTPCIEPFQCVTALPGPYRISNVETHAIGVATNKTSTAPYRGVGLPAAQYSMEHIIDMAAQKIGIDPAEMRRKNILSEDEFPCTAATGLEYDSATPLESLEMALEQSDYSAFRKRQETARNQGKYIGIGISSMIEMTAFGWDLFRNFGVESTQGAGIDSAQLRMNPNGTVTLYVGTLSHGQGHATTYAQLVAETLGIPPEDVKLVQGDTEATPFGWGTWGSRSAVQGGGAVLSASSRLREKILRIAGNRLEVSPEDLELNNGHITVKGVPNKSLVLKELAQSVIYDADVPVDEEPGFEATYHYKGVTPYANATHLAEVEVDPQTGAVKILRYLVIEDCGRMINPMIVEGQIAGGVAQGLGNVLYEHLQYDETGQLLTSSFMDYLLPTACDVPPIEYHHLETPSPLSEGGVKGMGEGGAVAPPPAIANAIADALSPFGWKPIETLPITPEIVIDQTLS